MTYHKNPFVFLPGLMGSFGGEMVGTSSGWGFGAARLVYDPVIKSIEQLGYRKNQNLFICFFDWRRSLEEIVSLYLLPLIKEIHDKFPNEPIDMMAHSMGGLVARAYIQGDSYFKKVDKLMLVGAPNEGAVDAYYYWATGNMPPKNKKSFFQLIYRGYIWMLRKQLKLPSGPENINELHISFPGLGELLPARGYGPFMAYHNALDKQVLLPNESARYKNRTLNQMNRKVHLLSKRAGSVIAYGGEGFETSGGLLVSRESFYQGAEQIKQVLKTFQGDGTVITRSAVLPKIPAKLLKRNHHELMTDAVNDLALTYEVKEAGVPVKIGDTLHLLFHAGTEFIIRVENTAILEYKAGQVLSAYPYLLEGQAAAYRWLILENLPEGNYAVYVKQVADQGLSMLLLANQLEYEIDQPVYRLSREPVATFYFHKTENCID